MDSTSFDVVDYLKKNANYGRVAALSLVFIVGGAVFYHIVEKLNWVDSFYFTVITLATVGYGDITPKTDLGKIFTIFYVFIGILIFLSLARIVLTEVIVRRVHNNTKDQKDT